MTWLKGHWQLLLLTAAVVLLWDTPVLVPLKILVVLFHEISHGVAAVLTGGEIVSLTVSPDQGGLAVTRGGSRFWILTAGYLGSLLIGVGLLLGALRSRADKALVAALGVVTLALTALYIRELFAVLFCLGIGLSLLAISRFLPRTANDLVLRIIGLTSMIYVPRDIFSDTIDRAHLRSDAYMLAEYLGGTGQIWGGIWLGISLAIILLSLRFALGRASNINLR